MDYLLYLFFTFGKRVKVFLIKNIVSFAEDLLKMSRKLIQIKRYLSN